MYKWRFMASVLWEVGGCHFISLQNVGEFLPHRLNMRAKGRPYPWWEIRVPWGLDVKGEEIV